MKTKTLSLSLVVLIAALFALYLLTPAMISPTNTSLVINGGGDYLQHYIGWQFFRNAPWSKHFLFMQNLNYPLGTSVIVTDSNPLFCLIFKIFRGVLPEQFQFNGIWLLSSYILIGVFAFLCGWKLTDGKPLPTFLAVGFALLNPVVMQRSMVHDTLTAHWLILAALWLLLNREERWNPIGWLVLVGLTMLIHVYFIPMIAFVLLLQLLFGVQDHEDVKTLLLPVLAFAAAFAASFFLFGYNYIQGESGSFGELSLNLNAFFDPSGTSLLLKSREHFPLQYEGYNYWGLGLLAAAAAGLICAPKDLRKTLGVCLLPAALLILVSASNLITFDRRVLLEIPLSERLSGLLSVFRSGGRLVWPLYYLVILGAVTVLSRRNRLGMTLLTVCFVIQCIDLSPCIRETRAHFEEPRSVVMTLPERLEELCEGRTEMFVGAGPDDLTDALALFAGEHHMSFNRCTNAREIRPIFGTDRVYLETLTRDDLSPDAVYIFGTTQGCESLIDSCPDLRTDLPDMIVLKTEE